jgi:hypothetical protein
MYCNKSSLIYYIIHYQSQVIFIHVHILCVLCILKNAILWLLIKGTVLWILELKSMSWRNVCSWKLYTWLSMSVLTQTCFVTCSQVYCYILLTRISYGNTDMFSSFAFYLKGTIETYVAGCYQFEVLPFGSCILAHSALLNSSCQNLLLIKGSLCNFMTPKE